MVVAGVVRLVACAIGDVHAAAAGAAHEQTRQQGRALAGRARRRLAAQVLPQSFLILEVAVPGNEGG